MARCGRCEPCLHYRRRIWVHRIMLEAMCHEANAFATLTYDEERLPISNIGKTSLPTLELRDVQLFLKRLRKRTQRFATPEEPQAGRIRYFVVGEYGDRTWRPHYHLALFGYPSCRYGQSTYTKVGGTCCDQCDLVRDEWGLGNVYLGSLEASSARYLCRYVLKRMTRNDDVRLSGRAPEFARMSLRPGIGRDAMFEVADVLMRHGLDASRVDVPTTLDHGRIGEPLGRYLSRALRVFVGKSPDVPEAVLAELQQRLLALRLAASKDAEFPSSGRQMEIQNRTARLSAQARRKIFGNGGSL